MSKVGSRLQAEGRPACKPGHLPSPKPDSAGQSLAGSPTKWLITGLP